MANVHMGLGKGLDALIRETTSDRSRSEVQSLPIQDIVPNPGQPRRTFSDKSLEDLSLSIGSQGLLQPILVRPLGGTQAGKYEIVAGERRYRASRLAGLKEVPVIIRQFSDLETLTAALVENLQREDLNPMEEALGIQTLKEEFGLSQEDLAKRLAKSRSTIANSLRLLSLPENVRKDIRDGKISAGHGRAILSIEDEQAQEYLRNRILEENLSVRETEGLAASWKESGTFTADHDCDTNQEIVPENQHDSEPVTGNVFNPKPKRPKSQSARLMELQLRMNELLQMPVKITGKEDKGKISLAYSSQAELERILQKLATLADDSGQAAALDGGFKQAMGHTTLQPVAGSKAVRLESPQKSALQSASGQPMLTQGED